MEKQDYFQAALTNFTFDVASGGAIRHLADLGYTAAQIRKRLDFPTPYDKIQQTIWEHFLQTGILRLEEPGTAGLREKYDYITEYDSYGRKSFRRISLSAENDAPVLWTEQRFFSKTKKDLAACLSVLCEENGEETAYITCDFGLQSKREPQIYEQILSLLEENDREYLLGLPWERKRVYHRLNHRMRNIVSVLYSCGKFSGTCYFAKCQKKLFLDFPGTA